jgi:hypothetical protein
VSLSTSTEKRKPKGDPAVTLQWSEWHGMREDLKEARRLLRMALEADRKGESIDVGQIQAFLR